MATGARWAVLDYIRLGEVLLDKWGDLARTIATQVDSEALTADKVTTNATECALLAAESLALMVNAACDAAAGFAGGRGPTRAVRPPTISPPGTPRCSARLTP